MRNKKRRQSHTSTTTICILRPLRVNVCDEYIPTNLYSRASQLRLTVRSTAPTTPQVQRNSERKTDHRKPQAQWPTVRSPTKCHSVYIKVVLMCQGENTYTKRLVICDLDSAYSVIVHKLGCAHSVASCVCVCASWWWCDDGYLFLLPSSTASSLYAVGRAHGHSARMEVMNERKTVHTRSYYTYPHTFKHNKLKHARADVDRRSTRDRDDTHRSNARTLLASSSTVGLSSFRVRPKTKRLLQAIQQNITEAHYVCIRIWESHVFVTRIVYLTLWYWNCT